MKLSQSIRFCNSADGTRIAVASCGNGPMKDGLTRLKAEGADIID